MFNKIIGKIKSLLYPTEIEKEYKRFMMEVGEGIRYKYPLKESSVVFDVGGYRGEFAERIYDEYKSVVYIFEPVAEFYQEIEKKFNGNDKIICEQKGLGAKSVISNINVQDNASSIFTQNECKNKETVEIVSAVDYINKKDIKKIDLFKVNIEGGEYELLESLIDSGLIMRIDNVQIQFHNFVENAEEKRMKIREKLALTHELTYEYKFIWENWVIKKA